MTFPERGIVGEASTSVGCKRRLHAAILLDEPSRSVPWSILFGYRARPGDAPGD